MGKNSRNYKILILMYFRRSYIIVYVLLYALWSQTSYTATIKIGEINPLSGKFAKQGIEIHQGIEVAIAEVNTAEGIDGNQIELITRDDQSQPEVAISRAEELCSWQNVVAVTGGYVDSLVGPIAAVTKKYKIPYVASASLQKELTQHNNPYFYRISKIQGFIDPLCGIIAAKFKPQRMAILHAATPGATELARDLEYCIKNRGLKVRLVEKFRPGTPDFTPLIAKLASMKIDVIVSCVFTPDHILFVRQLKENRMTPKAYIGPFGIAYESFIQALRQDADYLYSTCAWNPEITAPGTEEASASFVGKFQKMFGRPPNTTNMHGYTSAKVLITAIQKVLFNDQTLTGDNIRRSLTQLDLSLPMEHIVFDSNGDPMQYRHVVVQIQKGKFVVVYPPKRASGQAIYPMPSWGNRN
jgi:branched-chain amino acid transport system substrate-binding protein